ncbi:MAG: NnrU family protein [Bauldia sp.]
MFLLAVAALVFLVVHLAVPGSRLRAVLVEALGKAGYMAAYSAASLATLVWLIIAYKSAAYVFIWGMLGWWRPIMVAAMAPLFVLFAAGAMARHGAIPEGGGVPPVKGVHRITRHPMLVAVTLWAVVHMVGNGDLASQILFGSLAAMSVGGMVSMDRRKRADMGESAWKTFARRSPAVPFTAQVRGQGGIDLGEIGWQPVAVGLAAYAATLALHGPVIGIYPLVG